MDEKKTGARWHPFIGTMTVVLLVLAAASLFYAFQGAARTAAMEEQRNDFRLAVSDMATSALAAAGGQAAAFDVLGNSADAAAKALDSLPADDRPAAYPGLAAAAEEVTGNRQYVMAAWAAAADAGTAVSTIEGSLARLADAIPPESTEVAQEIDSLALRVSSGVQSMAAGAGDPDVLSRLAGDDELRLGRIVLGLAGEDATLGLIPVTGDENSASLTELVAGYRQLSDALIAAVAAAERTAAAHRSASQVVVRAGEAEEQMEAVGPVLPGGLSIGPLRLTDPRLGLGLLGAALLLALVGAAMSFSGEDTRKAAERQARQNERNQAAILRLLDELGSLADGDLTVQATVTEDITGAIADSINYAIEALRELVTTINDTAIKIDGAARQTQATSGHLAQASETQSKQVADATESIARMAASVEAVSGDSERSADVARHSVDVAHKGGEAVRRTIEGMNAIRETIQETSKRIKRLGESSQEIGNIVELINDAGRGFAVVADEVQRLAERSTNATRQIEVLVKTIQSDTNEAVVSMERSTTDVVGGALLAENAGAALEEIESVSNQIANLVQNISGTSREQAVAAADITRNMGVLREVSSQTAEATGATSESIGKLADLAAQLRNSVAGFRLPDTSGGPVEHEFPDSFKDADEPKAADA
jgi:twitching motility protein PilJ